MILDIITTAALHVRPDHHAASRSERREGRLLVSTMYCSTGSRNAVGDWPTVGTAAANDYPLGTRLRVEGLGILTVADRSAPGATQLDVYGGDDPGCQSRALAWGRRLVMVTAA